MIKNNKPLSLTEASQYLDESNDSELIGFVKKFTKRDLKEALKLRKNLEDLDLLKIRADHIVKIIDLMPETQEDLNKIFVDIGLDEEESKKILDEIKEFR